MRCIGRRVTLRALKGGLIALPLLGAGLCFEALWSESKRAMKERRAGDTLVSNLFATAAVVDGANGVVGLAEAAVLWKHQSEAPATNVCDIPIPDITVPAHPLQATWHAVERSLEWAELSPAFVYVGPVLAVTATAVAVAAEILAQQHQTGSQETKIS